RPPRQSLYCSDFIHHGLNPRDTPTNIDSVPSVPGSTKGLLAMQCPARVARIPRRPPARRRGCACSHDVGLTRAGVTRPPLPSGTHDAMNTEHRTIPANTVCLWYDGDALDAANFYAETLPDSAVTAVNRAPADYPSGKEGDVLTVEFTVCGIPCIGLNGGDAFRHSEAFSFQIATDNQAETDRLWDAIVGNGG